MDHRCFDEAVTHVRSVLSESFVPKFHKSSYCTAYILEVLRKDACLADVLLSDCSITYFMEFLEQKRQENHVLFWVSVQAFQEHLKRVTAGGGGQMEDVGSDAIALYDTYLSLQVTAGQMIPVYVCVERYKIVILTEVYKCCFKRFTT